MSSQAWRYSSMASGASIAATIGRFVNHLRSER